MKKFVRKSILMLFVTLVAAVFVINSPTAGAAEEEWTIPFLNTLTGPFSGWARMISFGAEDAAGQINNNGGLAGKKIVLKFHDTAQDASKAVVEMSKVIGDSLIIFGPMIDAPTQAVLPLVKRNNAFTFAITSSPAVLAKYRPHTISLWGEFDVALKLTLSEWLKANPDIKSVAIVYSKLDAYFIFFEDLYRKTLTELGCQVLDSVEVSDTVDMGAVVVKAMAQKPDGYCIIDAPISGGKVVLELDKRGLKEKKRLFLYFPMDDPGFYEIAQDAANGSYIWNVVNRKSTNPKWIGFEKRFKSQFPDLTPGMSTIPAQNMVYLAKAAVENLGLTGDPGKLKEERIKLMDYIANVKNFPGVTGPFDMNNCQLNGPAYLFRIENKDVVLLKEVGRD